MVTTAAGTGSLLLHRKLNPTAQLCRNNHHHHHQPFTALSFPKTTALSLPPLKQPLNPYSLKPHNSRLLTFSSLNPNFPPQNPQFFSNPSKTLTSLFSLISQFIKTQFLNLKTQLLTQFPQFFEILRILQDTVICTVGPLFFTGLQNGPTTPPLTAIASGMAKWLDIYSGVLMVRVLLSWFPNMQWEIQPFSAIRDLTDPYLSLFRKIVPPVFGTIDVSPLFAFAVLGTLGSILGTATV